MTDERFDGIQLRVNEVDPDDWPLQLPRLSCRQPNQIALEHTDLRLDTQREILFQGNGQLRSVGDLHFLTGATPPAERLSLLANGNLGIGTSTPTEKLEVAGKIKTTDLEASSTVKANTFHGDGSALTGLVKTTGDNTITGSLTIQNSLRVNDTVGIGTPNPQAKLQVSGGAIMPAVGNSRTAGIRFPSDPGGGAADEAFIRYFAESGETTKLLIGCMNDPDDRISFYQYGAERLTIYNGNVGIGTLSPQGKLDVKGDIRAGNSDIYFTEPNHNHTTIGNTTGYAAIENAANYGALMILGRAGTPQGRCVKLWDYLQVNGGLDVTGRLNAGAFNASSHVRLYKNWFWAYAWNGENSIYAWIYHDSRTYFDVHTWYELQEISYGEAGTKEGKMTLNSVTQEDNRTLFRIYVKNCYAYVLLNALSIRR